MTTAYAPTRPLCCRACAAAAENPEHHDRLLTVDVDVDELLALLEMAVTWHELDYSGSAVVGPAQWSTFAECHEWTFPDRAARAFSLALDIVGRDVTAAPPRVMLATVVDLVRG